MRILFLPIITSGPAVGTITRCLAVAHHLRLFGHEAFFLTHGDGAKHVAESDFPFMDGSVPRPPGPLHALRDLSDVAVFLNLTDEDYLRRSLETEQQAVERFKPDVLFSEFKNSRPQSHQRQRACLWFPQRAARQTLASSLLYYLKREPLTMMTPSRVLIKFWKSMVWLPS